MRSLIIVALVCVLVQTTIAATALSTKNACTATNNPFTGRCSNTNCAPYVADDSVAAASQTNVGGFGCSTVASATTYKVYSALTYGTAKDGTTNDYICSLACGDTATNLSNGAPCDATGTLCAVCATGYASAGKAPTVASPQPCACKVNSTDNSTLCTLCAHGYYGVDTSSKAITTTSLLGTGDNSYLDYSATNAAKCLACPTTLTNCAQCASNTTCAKCTAASGNTPDSDGSCSAAKVFASIALVFVGMVALLF